MKVTLLNQFASTKPSKQIGLAERPKGTFLYGGDMSSFFEWKFRTSVQLSACKDADERKRLTAKVVEGLSDQALSIAQEMGVESLMDAGG